MWELTIILENTGKVYSKKITGDHKLTEKLEGVSLIRGLFASIARGLEKELLKDNRK